MLQMNSIQDQLSFLAQAKRNAVSTTVSPITKKTHPIIQSNKQVTVIKNDDKFVQKKKNDATTLLKEQYHQTISSKALSESKIALKKPVTPNNPQRIINSNLKSSSDSNQNTIQKKPLSSQKIIKNNPPSQSLSINLQSNEQLSTQILPKQSSAVIKTQITAPTAKQLPSKQKSQSQSESKTRQSLKNEIIRPKTALVQQKSGKVIQSHNNQTRPQSAIPMNNLTQKNTSLSQKSHQQSDIKKEITPSQEQQLQQKLWQKSSNQPKQLSSVFSEPKINAIRTSNNVQTKAIDKKSIKNVIKTANISQRNSKDKQNKSQKQLKSDTNKVKVNSNTKSSLNIQQQRLLSAKSSQELISINKQQQNPKQSIQQYLTSSFFIILNESIVEQIMRFLSLKDISKFASVSRQARKLVPLLISKTDYSKSIEKTTTKIYEKRDTFGNVSDFLYNQNMNLSMLRTYQHEIEDLIQNVSLSSRPDKQQILGILKAGILVNLKLADSNINIADHIKKVGVVKAFECLSYDHVPPLKLKNQVPLLPGGNMNNRLYLFVRHVASYLRYCKECKLQVNIQRKYYQELRLKKIQEQFMQQKEKALLKYSKPITRLRSSSDIKDYLNKNVLSVIIPYLNLCDLCHLSMSSKTIKALVRESLLELLPSVEKQQSVDLEKAGISKDQAKSMVYLLHFKWYNNENHGIVMSSEFKNKIIKSLLLTIGKVYMKKGDVEYKYVYNKDRLEAYEINHEIKVPLPEKISYIVNFLKEFPTVNTIKEAMITQKRNQDIIHGVYLYQYIRGLQMAYDLALDDRQLDMEIYNEGLFKNDCKLYCYNKIIGIEQDDLLVLERPLIPFKRQCFKSPTDHLFYD